MLFVGLALDQRQVAAFYRTRRKMDNAIQYETIIIIRAENIYIE